MFKMKGTKRSLLMSGIALLLCVSMLIGSTFAWFTDSVVSAGNIIKSGTLDVTMDWADGTEAVPAADSADWIDASTGAIFNYDKWEPGYTEVRHIRIANIGTLALKYQLNIIPNGEVSDLADVIDVYYLDPAAQIAERGTIAEENRLGTLTEVLAGMSTSASGELLPTEGDIVTIALKMQESATNEYQDKSIGSSFSVQLLATQLTAEEDSFDDQYDKMATIDTEAELLEALAGDYDLIELGANIELTGSVVIPADKTVVIDLMGYTMSMTDDSTAFDNSVMLQNSGDLTILDSVGTGKLSYKYIGTDLGTTYAANTVRTLPGSTLAVKGGTIENLTYDKAVIAYAIDGLTNGGAGDVKVSIEGGNISALRQSIRIFANSTTNTGTLEISGGNIYGRVIIQNASAEANKAALKITGGTFTANEYKPEVLSVGGNNGATIDMNPVISGGVYNGEIYSVMGTKFITGGTYTVDPSAFVVDGLKAVLVGDVYEIVTNDTKYATASTAAELQTALDNASDVNLIVLTADIEGDVTAKQIADLDITINGDNHKYAGVILIDGNSATETTSSITLKNINFVADSISADACVQLGDGTTATRYTCNVTVDHCTFDVPGAVGIKSYTGGDKNLTISYCTATEKAHSLAQLKGIDGVVVDHCTVNAIRGISFNNSLNVTVQDSTIDVQKYAVRFGDDANTTVENYAIINSTLTSDCLENDAVIVLRAGATNANLTITNSTYTGPIPMSGHESANIVIN